MTSLPFSVKACGTRRTIALPATLAPAINWHSAACAVHPCKNHNTVCTAAEQFTFGLCISVDFLHDNMSLSGQLLNSTAQLSTQCCFAALFLALKDHLGGHKVSTFESA